MRLLSNPFIESSSLDDVTLFSGLTWVRKNIG